MIQFKKTTVFITGASAGIGLSLAKEFAAQDAEIVITGRRLDRLQKLASELSKAGKRVLPIRCDVTQEGDLESAVENSIKEFGKIDIVVANAGFGVAGTIEKLNIEDYRRQFETNIFGVLRTIYATLDQLKKTRGTLVLLGSVNGYVALPSLSAYCMSKFAIHALASSITHELKPHGISVVLIAPGFVESEIRQVDNHGKLHPKANDIVPNWLKMPSQDAAYKIIQAIEQKKREQIITIHGKLVILLKRYFPWILNLIVKNYLPGRPEPK